MDPTAITLIIGAIASAVTAVLGGLALYRKASAPHSAVVAVLRSLWNWLDYTRVDNEVIAAMRGRTVAKAVPPQLRRAVLRIIDPDALRGDNVSAQGSQEVVEDEDRD